MSRLKKSKFIPLFESIYNKYTHGSGFLAGETVKFKDNVKSSEWYKNSASTVQNKVNDMIEGGNNIRISVLKSDKPRSAGAFGLGDTPATMADIYEEISPSQWVNPMTVPLEVIEPVDWGVNLPAANEKTKRKDTTQIKPSKKEKTKDDTSKTKVDDKERNLSGKDHKQASKKWDDKKPGGGNYKKVRESVNSIGDAYEQVLKESANK